MCLFGKNAIIQRLNVTIDRKFGFKYMAGAANFQAILRAQMVLYQRITIGPKKHAFNEGMESSGKRLKRRVDDQALHYFQRIHERKILRRRATVGDANKEDRRQQDNAISESAKKSIGGKGKTEFLFTLKVMLVILRKHAEVFLYGLIRPRPKRFCYGMSVNV